MITCAPLRRLAGFTTTIAVTTLTLVGCASTPVATPPETVQPSTTPQESQPPTAESSAPPLHTEVDEGRPYTGDGYFFTVPPGWQTVAEPGSNGELMLRNKQAAGLNMNITSGAAHWKNLDALMAELAPQLVKTYEDVKELPRTSVGGQPAAAISGSLQGMHIGQLYTLHSGKLYVLTTAGTSREQLETGLAGVMELAKSWKFTS